MYHAAIGKSYFENVILLDDAPVNKNDVVVISLPFADTGDTHPQMDEILTKCSELGVPVLIDCCYYGACAGLTMDFDYSCITDITFSLAKSFPLGFIRVGMRLTRNDNNDPLFVYNKNNYVNRLGSAVGLELLNRYDPDYNYNTYKEAQQQFCIELGVEPSKCVFFATSKEKFIEYNRGTSSNRLCFSKYLKSGALP
jgi:histidinol-phosphate/aromatic aminotransferase/cobyric acid decarboxylase-like protein